MAQGTGLEDRCVIRNQKKLRLGYTTGSCAAGACRGAAWMLLGKERISFVDLMTPAGILLHLSLEDVVMGENFVSCAVRKDGGDDPDVTSGLLIYARVEKLDESGTFLLEAGEGVGRVTLPGLPVPVGEAAINPVPRSMILGEAREVSEMFGYLGGLRIRIFVPGGEETAKKTFNPRLGIVGGISILGTTGIVEPMSEKALVESIRLEMKQRAALGDQYLLVTPGNYGAEYLRQHMNLPFEKNIKCSNYVGETIDAGLELGIKGILFVSHIGKFIKVAGGIMNTHSHNADARMEILCAAVIRSGGDLETAREILECNTTDQALQVLKKGGLLEKTMEAVLERIQYYLDFRSGGEVRTGAVIFSSELGYLGQTRDAGRLIRELSRKE